jgi:hypothetical protein
MLRVMPEPSVPAPHRPPSLEAAFAAAERLVARRLGASMRETAGPMREHLKALLLELTTERPRALARGSADPDWVRRLVRGVATWTPEDDLSLIAALGAIARSTGAPPR